ncbi:MAG: hypothetical protein HZA53_18555 [Planctomycetes bacterium]|nr:hypothetical protein [Planctomycetota bacterium]
MDPDRPLLPAWLAGLVCTALPVAWGFGGPGLAPEHALAPWLILAAGAAVVLFALVRREPSARWCAWSAGAGAGVLVGVLLAQPTPTCWLMSDIAWHSAKIERVAEGAWLEDPILRVPTIYPFAFHLVLAAPVAAGVAVRTVLWAASPIVLALELWSFFWLLRAFVDVRKAAWGALALPFFFYAQRDGFAYLPNPFNASLVLVFLGLGALLRARADAHARLALGGGFALGCAGLCWYGHLPWITLAVLAWAVRARKQALWTVVGALPCALFLVLHLARLAGGEHASAIVAATAEEGWTARLAGMGRNLLTLSGGAELADAPWWLGLALLFLVAAALRRADEREGQAPALVPYALGAVALAMLGAGLAMTFWRPFSWRYGFLLYALALAWSARARPFRTGALALPLLAACALAAPWFAGRSALLCLYRSHRFEELVDHGGAEVGRFLAEHTRRDEPGFAAPDTWDRAIGPIEPRPNLVARNGGIYNFAPQGFVAPRWKAYEALLAATTPDAALAALAPYGFGLAVLARDELEKAPGLHALATGFEVRLETERYLVVDLRARR